jgi:hypothetical protein
MRNFVVTVEDLAAMFAVLLPHLDERQRRLSLGAYARMLGHGGGAAVAKAAGVRAATVSAGVTELESGGRPLGRVRKRGGGRKPVTETDPGLVPALLALVAPDPRGDPMSPLRWTAKSACHLAGALAAQGHPVGPKAVAGLLKAEGFSLQANAKTLEGTQSPDRDAQFAYINEQVKDHQAGGQPVVSVDAKKKELVGQYKAAGSEYRPKGDPEPVGTYDFPGDLGKAAPYGVYDPATNTGWVNVGVDHDTAAFAVESLRRWWNGIGKATYPDAARLLVTCDSGGSNSSRARLWKTELAALSAEIGVDITVCHFPPGTSKWNKIEHRLFSHISMNWRGRPLTSHDVIINTIAATTARTGLRVHAQLDTGLYPTGVKISDEQLARVPITRHAWHGDWNYTLHPAPAAGEAPAGAGPAAPAQRSDLTWLHAPALTGLTSTQWDQLLDALTSLHQAQHPSPTRTSGRKPALTLADRVAATLQQQRFATPSTVLADLTGISATAIRNAIRHTKPLLAAAGHTAQPTGITLDTATSTRQYATQHADTQ